MEEQKNSFFKNNRAEIIRESIMDMKTLIKKYEIKEITPKELDRVIDLHKQHKISAPDELEWHYEFITIILHWLEHNIACPLQLLVANVSVQLLRIGGYFPIEKLHELDVTEAKIQTAFDNYSEIQTTEPIN